MKKCLVFTAFFAISGFSSTNILSDKENSATKTENLSEQKDSKSTLNRALSSYDRLEYDDVVKRFERKNFLCESAKNLILELRFYFDAFFDGSYKNLMEEMKKFDATFNIPDVNYQPLLSKPSFQNFYKNKETNLDTYMKLAIDDLDGISSLIDEFKDLGQRLLAHIFQEDEGTKSQPTPETK